MTFSYPYEATLIHNAFGQRLKLRPEDVAVTDYDLNIHYTYGEMNRRAECLADYLQNDLHMEKGARLGMIARNCMVHIDAFFACWKTGIILSTYNGALSADMLTALLKSETPSLLLYDEFHAGVVGKLREQLPDLKALCFDNADFTPREAYAAILKKERPSYRRFDSHMEEICMLIHTGGTTGVPKAAKISYRNVFFNCVSQQMTYHLSEKDSTYLATALFHTAGWMSVTLPLLMAGGRILLQRKTDSLHLLSIIEKERLTFVLSVPTVYQRLLSLPDFKDYDLSSITRLRCGAAPLSFSLMQAYWEHGFVLANAYGMTEVGPANLCFPSGDFSIEALRAKAGTVGKPMAYNDVRIVDDAGTPVGDDTVGELQFKGPLVFSGYWGNVEGSIVNEEGWVSTGDLARRDVDGFYYIVGRRKNMYISGGENIYPYEIENELKKHEAIEDCCVIGVPDEEWGEVGKAFIVLKEGKKAGKEEICEWMKKRLSRLLTPRYYHFMDALPRNANGKLVYRELEPYATPED